MLWSAAPQWFANKELYLFKTQALCFWHKTINEYYRNKTEARVSPECVGCAKHVHHGWKDY